MKRPPKRKDPIKVTGVTRLARGLRRGWSTVEWAVTWLGLPRNKDGSTEPGLILLQIDGLSYQQLQAALEQGQVPFLQKLVDQQRHGLHRCYSGLPSNWAAAQAELLYGCPGAVPGSRYLDRARGQVVHLVQRQAAQDCERRLAEFGPGLLQGGSSYCNLFGGGAADVHFCATSHGWSDTFRSLNPLKLLVTLLLHLGILVRCSVGVLREVWQVAAAARGPDSAEAADRPSLWLRLAEVPGRVVGTVLLRELATLGACYDAARGVRIIQVNFFGYDEQAHRYGPASKPAARQLRAIDRSLRRIWKSAHLGSGREYDVWVFSTHGQQTSSVVHPSAMESVAATIGEMYCAEAAATANAAEAAGKEAPGNSAIAGARDSAANSAVAKPAGVLASKKAGWLGWSSGATTQRRWWSGLLGGSRPAAEPEFWSLDQDILCVPSGSLAFVYLNSPRARQRREAIAAALAQRGGVPLVCAALPGGSGRVWIGSATYELPENAVQVFGADHPHLGCLVEDLLRLIAHPDAGELVLCGWNGSGQTVDFLNQRGAHNGPGPLETTGFAFLPADIHPQTSSRDVLRPGDLRVAAVKVLDSLPLHRTAANPGRSRSTGGAGEFEPEMSSADSQSEPSWVYRALTYNIHGGVGMDGELSVQRIARVLGQAQADVICLQEVDRHRQRSNRLDQASAIADLLGMQQVFHPSWVEADQSFGNAILSRFPLEVVKAGSLWRQKAGRSARSAIWVQLPIGRRGADTEEREAGTWLQLINTHLSIYPGEQRVQARELAEHWIQPALERGPVVLCGDFNAAPGSATWSVLAAVLGDVAAGEPGRPQPTYFSPYPLLRVDHIFVSAAVVEAKAQVLRSRLAKIASDHLPVVADLTIPPPQPAGRQDRLPGARSATAW